MVEERYRKALKEGQLRKEMVLSFTPEDLLQFFTLKNGIWHVRCEGIPDGARVARVEYDARRHLLYFVLVSDDENFGCLIGKYCEPPDMGIVWEAKGMSLDEDRTRHTRA